MKKYKDLQFTWFGDISSYSGWAQHARELLRPLIDGGAQVRLELARPGRAECKLSKWWENQFSTATALSPGNIKICHGDISLLEKCQSNLPIILSTHWETQDVPNNFLNKLNSKNLKHIIVPNDSLQDSLDDKVQTTSSVINFPVNLNKLSAVKPLQITGVNDSTILYGTVGEWSNRHNLSDVVVAFLKSFTAKDNVALVLKTFGKNTSSLEERNKMLGLLRQIKRDTKKSNLPNIIVIQDVLSYDSMRALLSRINIYVTSSRGASKDISLMKCAAMGKQCIAPSHTAYQGIFEKTYPHIYEVGFSYEPVILSSGHYNINDSWARVDAIGLADMMMKAYKDLLLNIKSTFSKRDLFLKSFGAKYSPAKCAEDLAEVIRAESILIPTIDFTKK